MQNSSNTQVSNKYEFRSEPQKQGLPYAPIQPIIYLDNIDRPQPKKDRDNDKDNKDNIFFIYFIIIIIHYS